VVHMPFKSTPARHMSPRSWLVAILIVLLGASGISGYVAHGVLETSRDIYAITAWPLYVLIYCWMKADAKRRSVLPPAGAIPMIPLLLPIAIPYYLLATRGSWRGVVAVCLGSLFTIVTGVVIIVGEYIGRALFA
jgi:hypothetical protein